MIMAADKQASPAATIIPTVSPLKISATANNSAPSYKTMELKKKPLAISFVRILSDVDYGVADCFGWSFDFDFFADFFAH